MADCQSNLNGAFALCVDTGDYAASLMRWKIYPVIADLEAAQRGQLRIVDESGEDYLYPREFFRIIDLPSEIEQLYRASSSLP